MKAVLQDSLIRSFLKYTHIRQNRNYRAGDILCPIYDVHESLMYLWNTSIYDRTGYEFK